MANSESSTGLALDAASLMSIVLEGILYGRVSIAIGCIMDPVATKS
jgi:hypothetical protein